MNSSIYTRKLNNIAKAGAKCLANPADPPHRSGPAMQPFARPSIFRHGLSRCNGPLKSTRFYYPAKIFELLSDTAMSMIRIFVFLSDRHAGRVAHPVRMQAAK
ncbi:hypothetical protein [Mesorhizobium cantuariense]|uniref:Uncharacterized protein n=1 Tax=Mesorhizobium cantuariense TaxID=1300275 RepID=A0ABV7MUV5_9HYPH